VRPVYTSSIRNDRAAFDVEDSAHNRFGAAVERSSRYELRRESPPAGACLQVSDLSAIRLAGAFLAGESHQNQIRLAILFDDFGSQTGQRD
jgi:hypothetical protein